MSRSPPRKRTKRSGSDVFGMTQTYKEVNLIKGVHDEMTRSSFTPHLSRNLENPDVDIVVTPVMQKLFDEVSKSEWENTGYIIMGPRGIGKTTTLFWLYHNFVDNKDYEVYTIPLDSQLVTDLYMKLTTTNNTASSKKKLLVVDLNELQTRTAADIRSLTKLQLHIRSSKGFVIMAASSSFLAMLYVSGKEIKSCVNTLFDSLNKLEVLPSLDVAQLVATKMFPSINDRTKKWLVETARYNPLIISMYREGMSPEEYQANIDMKIYLFWSEMHDTLRPGDPKLGNIRKLLLALRYERPITEFQLEPVVAPFLFPILCKLVYLEEYTPQSYLYIRPFFIEEVIFAVSTKMGARSDEPAAIGYSYEIAVLHLVSETVLHTITSDSGASVEELELPKLAVVPKRFVVNSFSDFSCLPSTVIYMTEKGTQAIDAFVKINDNSIVLIQTSIQATNNTGKVKSIVGTPLFIHNNMFKNHVLNIYYLYLNPVCEKTINDLKNYFFAALPPILNTDSLTWHFCMPSNCGKFMTEYLRIKTMMQISP